MIALKQDSLTPAQIADIVDLVRNHEEGHLAAMQRHGLRRDQLLDVLQAQGVRREDWFQS